MSIIRVKKSHSYTVIDNDPLHNKSLTWAARGMLAYLLTKPDDWTVRTSDLIKQSPAGRRATNTIIKELKEAGYMTRHRVSGKGGKIEWETEVYEKPTIGAKRAHGEATIDAESVDGERAHIVSTDSPSTDKDIKDSQPSSPSYCLDFNSSTSRLVSSIASGLYCPFSGSPANCSERTMPICACSCHTVGGPPFLR